LATASDDNTVGLWDLTNQTRPSRIATLTGHTSTVFGVAFSPDGHTLATASDDHTAELWDLTNPIHPTRIATLTGHTGPVFGVAFSPDGHTLATGSYDNTAGLWDLHEILALLGHFSSWSCTAAGGGLTPEQWVTFAPGIPYRPTC
jgi:WD40 repeat protein